MTGRGDHGKAPVEAVLELHEAILDARVAYVLALVHHDVVFQPLVRPGLSRYFGHEGMTRQVTDLHSAHGRYQVEVISITEQAGPQVTVQARLLPEPGRGRPACVRTVYGFRDGLIGSIESFPDDEQAASPAHPGREIPGHATRLTPGGHQGTSPLTAQLPLGWRARHREASSCPAPASRMFMSSVVPPAASPEHARRADPVVPVSVDLPVSAARGAVTHADHDIAPSRLRIRHVLNPHIPRPVKADRKHHAPLPGASEPCQAGLRRSPGDITTCTAEGRIARIPAMPELRDRVRCPGGQLTTRHHAAAARGGARSLAR